MITTAITTDALCLALMRADTVDQVEKVLTDAGYWDDPKYWRPINDDENNYSTIGNQQSEGIAALVEKIVNGVDARLVDACLRAGVDPESNEAPQSMIDAVARFFPVGPRLAGSAGRVSEWGDAEATEQAKLLTVSATGLMPAQGNPSISIADQGEGQTPDRVPDTFMSLGKSNKLRVPFVQGKFNMGGTGALLFSGGDTGMQLIVTRRDPELLGPDASDRDKQWSFTVVRREDPRDGARSSIYTYLAPVGAEPSVPGAVLAFTAAEWPIFPESDGQKRDAYSRTSAYGSLIKLYEYEWRGSSSNIVLTGNGLLRRIDVGLPELALPVRLYECRPNYKGDAQSFSTNALGIVARLGRDRARNLENSAVIGAGLTVAGTQVPVRIYVFQKGRAQQYKSAQQGVIFSVNGQTHAMQGIDFFRRSAVGLNYLAEDLLVVVDCSSIEGRMREDIFMNSRDRLRDRHDARELETALQRLLHDDPTLKELANRRREEALRDKLSDDKPLADVLKGLLKSSPMLSRLLFLGQQIPSPFPPSGGTSKGNSKNFVGKRFPTYFRIRGAASGEPVTRQVALGSSARFTLETDAEDDYFSRVDEPGAMNVRLISSSRQVAGNVNWVWNGPKDGILHLTLTFPEDMEVGDDLSLNVEIIDPVRADAFECPVSVSFVRAAEPGAGGGKPNPPDVSTAGSGKGGGSGTLALPNVVEVHRDQWGSFGFDEESALSIISSGSDGTYDFYINVDNKYLKTTQKDSKDDAKLIEKQFSYGFVVLGLSLIQDAKRHPRTPDGVEREPESEVKSISRALAPVLVPMLQSIGTLSELDI